jgi:hypothetical protein
MKNLERIRSQLAECKSLAIAALILPLPIDEQAIPPAILSVLWVAAWVDLLLRTKATSRQMECLTECRMECLMGRGDHLRQEGCERLCQDMPLGMEMQCIRSKSSNRLE